jgi:glutamine synthetase
VVRRVAERLSALGYELACGPELEFYLCQQAPDDRWRRYADDPGNVSVVDRSLRLKSAVQEIARQRDLMATFMAKPFNDEGGSGFHVHVSVNDETGRNVFGDPGGPDGLSAAGRHAIGGVLAHARALSALLNLRSTPTSGSAPTRWRRG